MAWQTIESAPKDGRKIILCSCREGYGYVAFPETFYWLDGDWFAEVDGQAVTTRFTHWMPLPPAPTPTDEGKA
jgi:hypothetical protein